jgi:hypothetical protein
MTKVRTFSRIFPKGHVNEVKQTLFVEKILNGLSVNYQSDEYYNKLLLLNDKNIKNGKLSYEDIETFFISLQNTEQTKYHTIRNGFSIKNGDKLSPRVWFGKPYSSPQIIFYEDLTIHSLQNFKNLIKENWCVDGKLLYDSGCELLSYNNGLTHEQMLSWFNKEIDGQIICWKKDLIY